MVNRTELAICRRRGHAGGVQQGWSQCKWCGTWLREVRKMEEREDEPPEDEMDARVMVQRRLGQFKSEIESGSLASMALHSKVRRAPRKAR